MQEIKRMGKKITLCSVLSLLAGCASMQHTVKPEKTAEELTYAQLEAMTTSGQFPLIAAYVHQQIDQHPDQYMNELYNGAEIALKHAPNGVYELAIDQYEEDVSEYFETKVYVMQQMQERGGGFSYNSDLNYDE